MSFRSTAVQEVLDRGQFCAVAAMTPRGPHCTPLVFANSGARLWLTTSRRSVKARAWRTDPSVAGLVRSDEFRGALQVIGWLAKLLQWGNFIRVSEPLYYRLDHARSYLAGCSGQSMDNTVHRSA